MGNARDLPHLVRPVQRSEFGGLRDGDRSGLSIVLVEICEPRFDVGNTDLAMRRRQGNDLAAEEPLGPAAFVPIQMEQSVQSTALKLSVIAFSDSTLAAVPLKTKYTSMSRPKC